MNPFRAIRRILPKRQLKASHAPVERLARVEVDKRPAPTAHDALHEALRSEGAGDYVPTPKEAGWKPLPMEDRFRAAEGADAA